MAAIELVGRRMVEGREDVSSFGSRNATEPGPRRARKERMNRPPRMAGTEQKPGWNLVRKEGGVGRKVW